MRLWERSPLPYIHAEGGFEGGFDGFVEAVGFFVGEGFFGGAVGEGISEAALAVADGFALEDVKEFDVL